MGRRTKKCILTSGARADGFVVSDVAFGVVAALPLGHHAGVHAFELHASLSRGQRDTSGVPRST